MISIGLSPNTQKDDVWQAIKTIFQFWQWQHGNSVSKVEDWFKDYISNFDIFSTNSGRSAMWFVLKTFGIGNGDEVILQAFTCLAVPEVIIWIGAVPVFVDVDDSINIDYRKLERSITPKTKAIIVQHTFGIPANIKKIKEIAQKYNLILIEDCAHSLGATVEEKRVGTFGDAAFFSFGRDKVISSVFGGLAAIKKTHQNKKLIERAHSIDKELSYPSNFWIFQQLLHPIISWLALSLYDLGIGKLLLVISQKLNLLSFPIFKEEKMGKMPEVFPKKNPNALATLLLNQLQKLYIYNQHRIKIAKAYQEELGRIKNITIPKATEGSIFLRYNILVENPDNIRKKAKQEGFLLGNWYHDTIDPKGTRNLVGYKKGSCPHAESIAEKSLNLPTHIKMPLSWVERLISIIKNS
ncbi:aminotransferase class I/II-fold pyridoxal phosphate-dependent enzyme [Candidatus Gottesmanbacteria bacterium]|nr:aminotransferase class I/II-fold pyridoxal phosphate-dependent enzyme [Candidatus Gottesmanbacteria bacterium]